MTKRIRIAPKPGKLCIEGAPIDNKPPKDWDLGYELVVSFQYGLDEEAIAKAAGLKNYDTGVDLFMGIRDLMFPCGIQKETAYLAARRLRAADHFCALRLKISYPVEKLGNDSWTCWYSPEGKLIDAVKHRKLGPQIVTKIPAGFKIKRTPLRVPVVKKLSAGGR